MYDVIIIGAGVIGTAVMRELSKYKFKIITLEKSSDVSTGTTKANTAIVHAGYNAGYGTIKAKFNKIGNDIYGEVCDELNVPFERIGSYVLAFNEEELKVLEELKENGDKLGIPGLEIIERDKILKEEPNINEDVKYALYAPTAGIVEPWELAIAYAENAMDNDAELKLDCEVINIEKEENSFKVYHKDGFIKSKIVINCAGVYADEIYSMITENDEFEITPRKGEYYLLDKTASGLVNSVIFQCPTEISKGVLVAPTADGNIIIGPNAEDLDKNNKDDKGTTEEGLNYVFKNGLRTSKKIPFKDTIRTFAGLRAQPSTGDFIIKESKKVEGFINVAGIKSPGLSAAPAIGKHVEQMVVDILKDVKIDETYNPIRKKRIKFSELNDEEKNELIKKDPRYGHIICRCEGITEGEIVDAIHRNCGAKTVNGVKRRVRPGAGRCQGGFCGPRVLEILSRELNMEMTEIRLENKGSEILTEKTKSAGGNQDD